MEKNRNFSFITFFQKTACGVVALFTLFTIWQNLDKTVQDKPVYQVVFIVTVSMLLFFGMFFLAKKKISEKTGIVLIASISFIIRLFFIISVQTPAEFDFYLLLDAAKKLYTGGGYYDLVSTNLYFTNWAYQIPFVTYEAIILKIFHTTFAIKLLNVLFMMGINVLIYLICREFVSTRAAMVPALMYAVYPAPIFLSSVLTNQHISAFFIFLGLYFQIRFQKMNWSIFAALCLCIGNLMRPAAPLILVSIALYLLLLAGRFFFQRNIFDRIKEKITGFKTFIKTRGKGFRHRIFASSKVLSCLTVIICYFIFSVMAGATYMWSGLAPNGISNNLPEWKFVVGLNPLTSGSYTEMNADILKVSDKSKRQEMLKEDITENFQGYGKGVWSFIEEKTRRMWASDDTYSWSCSHMDLDRVLNQDYPKMTIRSLLDAIFALDKAMYLVIMISVLGSAVLSIVKRKIPSGFLLIFFIWGAAYGVYLLIEIQTRYRYVVMPVLFILSSLFVEHFFVKRRSK